VLFGYSEGAPMSILFAATYPERVTSLVLGSAAARWFPAADYPCGPETEQMFAALTDIAAHRWGQGDTIEWYLPSRSGSPHARQLFARFERMAISPSAFLRMTRMIREIDVRAALPAIHVPTLVLQRLDDRITPPFHGRYLASRIAGARYFEQPGDHSLRFTGGGDDDALWKEIEDFLTACPGPREADRVLSTILVAEIDTETIAGLAGLPDGARSEAAGQHIRHHRGQLIDGTGGGILATFDAPGRAIRCAAAVRADAASRGSKVRIGIHTGEVDLIGEGISGASVYIARGIAAFARPAEILVSRTVKDLVAGSGIAFAERGGHNLIGLPEEWPLFAIAGL
jgi:hypothetical protein